MKTMEDYNKILVIFVFFIFMSNENIIYANGGEMKINKIDISSFIYRSDHIFVGKVIDLMEIENIPDDWRSSFALSEIMLFHNR